MKKYTMTLIAYSKRYGVGIPLEAGEFLERWTPGLGVAIDLADDQVSVTEGVSETLRPYGGKSVCVPLSVAQVGELGWRKGDIIAIAFHEGGFTLKKAQPGLAGNNLFENWRIVKEFEGMSPGEALKDISKKAGRRYTHTAWGKWTAGGLPSPSALNEMLEAVIRAIVCEEGGIIEENLEEALKAIRLVEEKGRS